MPQTQQEYKAGYKTGLFSVEQSHPHLTFSLNLWVIRGEKYLANLHTIFADRLVITVAFYHAQLNRQHRVSTINAVNRIIHIMSPFQSHFCYNYLSSQ